MPSTATPAEAPPRPRVRRWTSRSRGVGRASGKARFVSGSSTWPGDRVTCIGALIREYSGIAEGGEEGELPVAGVEKKHEGAGCVVGDEMGGGSRRIRGGIPSARSHTKVAAGPSTSAGRDGHRGGDQSRAHLLEALLELGALVPPRRRGWPRSGSTGRGRRRGGRRPRGRRRRYRGTSECRCRARAAHNGGRRRRSRVGCRAPGAQLLRARSSGCSSAQGSPWARVVAGAEAGEEQRGQGRICGLARA
jgi:hypothetical protein